MKRALLLLCGAGLALSGAEIGSVRSVYMIPMANGLDQYLANRLTNEHVLQVVTDPKKADAVFTDRIGEALEERLDEMYPPPEPPPPPNEEADKKEKKDDAETPPGLGDTVNKLEKPGRLSTWGRGKGTLFLVDARSRAVLWSTFEKPKSSQPKELDRTATRIVSRLKKDISGK